MIGTHTSTMGGISSVVRGYREGGLFKRYDCTYIATHRDGSSFVKAATAAAAYTRVAVELARGCKPLLHIHLSSRASFWRKLIVCMQARVANRPYILHVHGSEFMPFYENECGPSARARVRGAFEHASLVLALSNEWRDNLQGICPGIPVEVLSNAVSLPDLSSASVARTSVPDSFRILSLGRIGKRKGSYDLLEAFAGVSARVNRATLVLAGDGEIEAIRARARELGIAERVELPGWLDREAIARELAQAHTFALPSYAEGLPMALLEAMSWALPVISSPVGGIPQVVHHEHTGLLVQPGDVAGLREALLRMANDTQAATTFGLAARELIAREFSLDAHIDRLGHIYERFGIRPLHAPASAASPRLDAL